MKGLALVILLWELQYVFSSTPQCSRYCKDYQNSGFQVGSKYVYKYFGKLHTSINSGYEKNKESDVQFETDVEIGILSNCDFVLKLSNVNCAENFGKLSEKKKFETGLAERPLHFSFEDGRIDTLCPPEGESEEILNIKRAILSSFQNNVPVLQKNSIMYESDVSGNCETRYKVLENSRDGYVIEKNKNLNTCSQRAQNNFSWQSISSSKNVPLLRSTQNCIQKFNNTKTLLNSVCTEKHVLQPFSNGDSGAMTSSEQILHLIGSLPIDSLFELPNNIRRTSLLFQHVRAQKIRRIDVTQLLEKLDKTTIDQVEYGTPKVFSQLIFELRGATYNQLIDIFRSTKTSFKKRKFLLNAMALITTVDSIKVMQKLHSEGEIDDAQLTSWIGSIMFTDNPSLALIGTLNSLQALEPIRPTLVLSLSSLIFRYCKTDDSCLMKIEIKDALRMIEEPLVSGCVPKSTHDSEILFSLKGIGNAGVTTSLDLLKTCYLNSEISMEIRLASIAAHHRMNCFQNENLENLLELFSDHHQNTEIRIAAYLAVMHCVDYTIFASVKEVLHKEETNQVGSFVWTHLTNLQETSATWKQNARALIENEFLKNKFNTDVRKYSRNYEISKFFDSLNIGGTVESNVIFTPDSYLPKSAVLNFTVNLFGEMVNILEIGGRMEGFEQTTENLFGPNEFEKKTEPDNNLAMTRYKSERKHPSGSFYAKIFGNEYLHFSFKNLQTDLNSQNFLKTILKLIREQEIEYSKSFKFLEANQEIPTLLGFPLKLAISGTSIVGLTVKGRLDLESVRNHKIEGKFYPSIAVEIVGEMNANIIGNGVGIKLINTMNSNGHVDGHVCVKNGKIFDLKINVPKEQIDVIKIQSQIFRVRGNYEIPLEDITDDGVNTEICTGTFFSKITGLQLCHHVQYINASVLPNAPYFPLTGTFRYSMGIKKTDHFDDYRLILHLHDRFVYNMSFFFDTKNSLINRKINATFYFDRKQLSMSARLDSPLINLEINSRIINEKNNRNFSLQALHNHKELISLAMFLKNVEENWAYGAKLNYRQKQLAKLSGTVNYIEKARSEALLKIEGVGYEPIIVTSDISHHANKYEIAALVKCKILNSKVELVVEKTKRTFLVTAKSVYNFQDDNEENLYFEFKTLHYRSGSFVNNDLHVNFESSQKPLYNTLIHFNSQRNNFNIENSALITLFKTTWKFHQLFKSERPNVTLECSITCPVKQINYSLNLIQNSSKLNYDLNGSLQIGNKSFEFLWKYNVGKNNRLLDILIGYPKHKLSFIGNLDHHKQNEYNLSFTGLHETDERKTILIFIKGNYLNFTTPHFQNHTVEGVITIPEIGGILNVNSTLHSSNDLLFNKINLKIGKDFYTSDVIWRVGNFSGILKKNENELFVLNVLKITGEIDFTIGLNVYQYFELSSKFMMAEKKFRVMFFWDKNNDSGKKILFVLEKHDRDGLYLAELEYPDQRIVASLNLLPSQLSANITWGLAASRKIYLTIGNKLYDIGGIWYGALETPFGYLEKQEFKLSYYVLPGNCELKSDLSWRNHEINLIVSGSKSRSHLSGYLQLNTTLPEISKINFAASHTRENYDSGTKTKNDAVLEFNDHKIIAEFLQRSEGMNVTSSFHLESTLIDEPVTGLLVVNTSNDVNVFTSFVNWGEKTITVDCNVELTKSFVVITSPFENLERSEFNYTVVGDAGKLLVDIRLNFLRQINSIFLEWNVENHVMAVNFDIVSPITGIYKLLFRHSLLFGRLNEALTIVQGLPYNEILVLNLSGSLLPLLNTNVTATAKLLSHCVNLTIINNPRPIKSLIKINWNDEYIISTVTGTLIDNRVRDLRWNVNSNLKVVKIRYRQNNISHVTSINVDNNYKLEHTLILTQPYKSIENKVTLQTPLHSASLHYLHKLTPGHFNLLLHARSNKNEGRFRASYDLFEDSIVDGAMMELTTPWYHPIAFNFTTNRENGNSWKPKFWLEYANQNISVNSSITFGVKGFVVLTAQILKIPPVNLAASYDFSQSKKIKILIKGSNFEINATSLLLFEINRTSLSFNSIFNNGSVSRDLLRIGFDYNFSKTLQNVDSELVFLNELIGSILFANNSTGFNFASEIKFWKNNRIRIAGMGSSNFGTIIVEGTKKNLTLLYEYEKRPDKFHVLGNMNYGQSRFGGHLTYGKNISFGLILPSRIVNFDSEYFVNKTNEFHHARFAWNDKDSMAVKIIRVNLTNDDKVQQGSLLSINLPFVAAEIWYDFKAYFTDTLNIHTNFGFVWNDGKWILKNVILPGQLESRLSSSVLKHDIILKTNVSYLNSIPSYLTVSVKYSSIEDDLIEFGIYYNETYAEMHVIERRVLIRHPSSKIDYLLKFSTLRTSEVTNATVVLYYMDYQREAFEEIKASLKLGHKKFQLLGLIETNKNSLQVSGNLLSTHLPGVSLTVKMNDKDPISIKIIYNLKIAEPSFDLLVSNGDRKYNWYAGMPSTREISARMTHQTYGKEIIDGLFIMKLNTSQLLWVKLRWNKNSFPYFQKLLSEEYTDIRYVIEAMIQETINAIHDDFGKRLVNDITEIKQNFSKYFKQEIKFTINRYETIVNSSIAAYRKNAFYLRTVTALLQIPELDVFKNIYLVLFEFVEILYEAITNIIVETCSAMKYKLEIISSQIENFIKQFKDIKNIKAKVHHVLKIGINNARQTLKNMKEDMIVSVSNFENYVENVKNRCEELFEPYLSLLDEFIVYVEQRLAIIQIAVLDTLDTIQHYILNLRETREILKAYACYLNWLEEFHISKILDPIGDVIEMILETVIEDVNKIISDYRPYIDALIEALFGNYKEFNKVSPIKELRENLNNIYQRTVWIWNYYQMAEVLKNHTQQVFSEFDEFLEFFVIEADSNGTDFEYMIEQTDYVFRPDLGWIEINQPLPVEWVAFDQIPAFEQHPIYENLYKKSEYLFELHKYQYDIVNAIQSHLKDIISLSIMPPTNNIAMLIGGLHYVTFNKKQYSFIGDCSYVLAGDFMKQSFSVVANYGKNDKFTNLISIGLLSDQRYVEIFQNFTIKLNGQEVDLPLIAGSFVVTLEGMNIIAEYPGKVKIACNNYYNYCAIELSGWYFGRTGGLLGTLDNEQRTDISLPGGNVTKNIVEFARSWEVKKCDGIDHSGDRKRKILSPLVDNLLNSLCGVFFNNSHSPVSSCFLAVNPKPFYDMCTFDMKTTNPTVCTSVAAYKVFCDRANIPVNIPPMCIRCPNTNLRIDSEEEIFDGNNPNTVDVVFITQLGCFNQSSNIVSLSREIDLALLRKGFTKNRFALVGYGGKIFKKPHIYSINGEIWNEAIPITKIWHNEKSLEEVSAINAIKYASELNFRSGVTKIFILLHCNACPQIEDLNAVYNMLTVRDITLHTFKPRPFNQEGYIGISVDDILIAKGKHVEDIFVGEAHNEKIIADLNDSCGVLALTTSGSIANTEYLKNYANMSVPWAKFVSKNVKTSPCQRCKCVNSEDGTGKLECSRCLTPEVKQLLKEYESNLMEFRDSK